jgi:hypothetical protein
MIACLAGALALAGFPAFAGDLPDYGSKNFTPTEDTPTYFANESVPVSARIADASPRDWSAEDAVAPVPSVAVFRPSAHPKVGRHGRYGSAKSSPKHGIGKSTGHTGARSVKASGRKTPKTATSHRPAGRAAAVSKNSASRVANSKSTTRSRVTTAAKTAKQGKPDTRHATAADKAQSADRES